jgi:putative FmdB family regulatory protein
MPTYEYACRTCGEHVEVVQSFSDAPLTECPKCGGPLRKVFGSIGIVLKGSGFYRTDSRAASDTKGARAGDGATGTDGKTDATTDATKGAKKDHPGGEGGKAGESSSANKSTESSSPSTSANGSSGTKSSSPTGSSAQASPA